MTIPDFYRIHVSLMQQSDGCSTFESLKIQHMMVSPLRLFPLKSLSPSFLILPMLAICLVACDDLPFDKERVTARDFTIRSGEHYATPRLMETTEVKRVAFLATFDESARYAFADKSQQADINKLMGFSDCSTQHHENSARFGWRWYNEQLEIHAYCYVDSVRIHEWVGTVNIGEENRYEIAVTPGAYEFFLNGEKKATIDRAQTCEEGLNYLLYPYFGGSVPAPHDVRIKIEMLD